MYKYEMSWKTKDGRKIENQIFTAEKAGEMLKNLEEWKATDIILKLITVEERK